MQNESDKEFLAAFMQTARYFTRLSSFSKRDPKAFELVERRAAEILDHPPVDLHHRVMEHMNELREEQGGLFGGHNSELLEELGDYPQARRVFYAVIAACQELGPDLDGEMERRRDGGNERGSDGGKERK